MTALIRCEDIAKVYGNGSAETTALAGVSFSIEKGEFVALMGPSGSGKSTLMHILGLLDGSTSGTYLFDGRNVETFSSDELAHVRNRDIGFIFQSFNLLPRTSVFENVELPLLYDPRGDTRAQREKKVANALESVGMGHRREHMTNQLSGGEMQRVAIARALVNNPHVIFADEPTGNLDSKSGLAVMQILQDLNDSGHTVVLVTHETSTAQHAKRMLYLKDGRILADDSVRIRRIAREEQDLAK
jgi:putative ABC transport system ATP-binding protein